MESGMVEYSSRLWQRQSLLLIWTANTFIFSGKVEDAEMFSIGYIEYCVPLSLRADSRDNDAPVSVTQLFCRPVLLDMAQLKP
jgi:hypothetical protein